MDNKALSADQEERLLKTLKLLIKESDDELLQCSVRHMDKDVPLQFLRCRKYNVQSAFEKLQRFVHNRMEKYPEIFEIMYPERLKAASNVYRVLKSRDPKGRRVIVHRSVDWKPDAVAMEELAGMLILIVNELLKCKETQLKGITIINDTESFDLNHLRCYTFSSVRKYVDLYTSCPVRIKGIHSVNCPWIVNKAISLVKMFLSKKLSKRILSHGSMEKLHEHFDPKTLPTFLGGLLSDEQAFDHKLFQDLYTKEKNDYYKQFIDF